MPTIRLPWVSEASDFKDEPVQELSLRSVLPGVPCRGIISPLGERGVAKCKFNINFLYMRK